MLDLLSSLDINTILIAGTFGGYFGQSAKRLFRNPTRIFTDGGLIPDRIAKKSRIGGFLATGSINPTGNPIGRGEVPVPPEALPPAAQLPTTPFQNGVTGRGRRRRGNGTILTGPRGLQSGAAGKSLLGV